MNHPDEATHFLARRAELADGLARLLGPRAAASVTLADAGPAAAVAAELRASHGDAEPHDWALVRHAWPAHEATVCADALHRLARNLGPRPVWLVGMSAHAPAQAAALDSEAVLDNPFGFAALAATDDAAGTDAAELRLLDRDVAAGLWLTRDAARGWELAVWGEPWLSATTRALRGVG
jgi:hypothetical protein